MTDIQPDTQPDKQQLEAPDHAGYVAGLRRRYDAAKARRQNWHGLWRDCYDFAMPQRGDFTNGNRRPGTQKGERVFDATALAAVDQLAASLLGNLTPPWSQWFGFKPGPDLSAAETESLKPVLEEVTATLQDHLERSNFAVEIHQCFLDLVVGGTASLYVEEAEPGAQAAFNFTAVPLSDVVLQEGAGGHLDTTFRESHMRLEDLQARFPGAQLPASLLAAGERDAQAQFTVIEAVVPDDTAFVYCAFLKDYSDHEAMLARMRLPASPFISFRWMKSPGEIYGRSPVMKSLPDIKTANKVVELTLKNASIAVSGIWQADDDGVLNPANVELKPGAIVPKAVGSQGLQPLEMPGRFDISELVLEDLRARIRHALLADKLPQINDRRMTATEVLERSAEMGLLLGATYGRLQSELLTPLVDRAFNILRRRGEIPDITLDGRTIALEYRSPLAKAQGQRNVQNTLSWLESVMAMDTSAREAVDFAAVARFLGDALGVPGQLIREDLPPAQSGAPSRDDNDSKAGNAGGDPSNSPSLGAVNKGEV